MLVTLFSILSRAKGLDQVAGKQNKKAALRKPWRLRISISSTAEGLRPEKIASLNKSNLHQAGNAARAFIENARHFLSAEYLPKIERCLEQLNDDQIWWRANPESNSIGNLVLHLCGNARQWIIAGLAGQTDNRRRDAEFSQTEVIPCSELREILRTTLAEVEAVITALDPETLLEKRMIQ